MATTYGTIDIALPPSDPPLLSNADQRIRSGIGTQRPWKEMLPFSIPQTFNIALQRIKSNVSYFHVNYAIIVLFMLFLSLLWHPISLMVYIVNMAAWLFLYFLRDDPVVVFGYGVDERVILAVLTIFTVVLLLSTHAAVFLMGMVVGVVVVVVVHASFRRTSDLIPDEELLGESPVDLKVTASASASYSSSL
ncbi:PRA1 family protein F2 [Abeliophyllum distichum]|uniref:PRA1 family protein n=1 Tax=Abeliophyllum distichum TaxID=126358 RepID=A0ABD1QWT8_9LAMI